MCSTVARGRSAQAVPQAQFVPHWHAAPHRARRPSRVSCWHPQVQEAPEQVVQAQERALVDMVTSVRMKKRTVR
jgi:hypothetical protein